MKKHIKPILLFCAAAIFLCGCKYKDAGYTPLTVFYSDMSRGMEREVMYVEEISPKSILSALEKRSVIPEGVTCNSFAASPPDENGRVTLYLDLSDKIAKAMKRTGCIGERMMLNSLADTFLAAYDADIIYVSVNGAELDSGRCRYSNPISIAR